MTVSGSYFNFLNPDPDSFTIQDVAHALSMVCRFSGHVKHFYSVAQHAVLVSYAVPGEMAWYGLHHDDAEFALGDVSSPLKRLLPDYREIEARVSKVVAKKFNLPDKMPPEIKLADRILLATEKRDLMPNAAMTDAWDIIRGLTPLKDEIIPLYPHQAERLFLNRYKQLGGVL